MCTALSYIGVSVRFSHSSASMISRICLSYQIIIQLANSTASGNGQSYLVEYEHIPYCAKLSPAEK